MKRVVFVLLVLAASASGCDLKYSEADFLANCGMSVLIDAKHQIAHNKIMIIDDETVITGSFNFPELDAWNCSPPNRPAG